MTRQELKPPHLINEVNKTNDDPPAAPQFPLQMIPPGTEEEVCYPDTVKKFKCTLYSRGVHTILEVRYKDEKNINQCPLRGKIWKRGRSK